MPTFSDIFSIIADLDERTTQGHQPWRPGDSPHSFTTEFQGLQVTISKDAGNDQLTAVLTHPKQYFTETYMPQETGSNAVITLGDLYEKVSGETSATTHLEPDNRQEQTQPPPKKYPMISPYAEEMLDAEIDKFADHPQVDFAKLLLQSVKDALFGPPTKEVAGTCNDCG